MYEVLDENNESIFYGNWKECLEFCRKEIEKYNCETIPVSVEYFGVNHILQFGWDIRRVENV